MLMASDTFFYLFFFKAQSWYLAVTGQTKSLVAPPMVCVFFFSSLCLSRLLIGVNISKFIELDCCMSLLQDSLTA